MVHSTRAMMPAFVMSLMARPHLVPGCVYPGYGWRNHCPPRLIGGGRNLRPRKVAIIGRMAWIAVWVMVS